MSGEAAANRTILTANMETIVEKMIACAHCGEPCPSHPIRSEAGVFCCQGCRLVYELLDRNGLSDYYQLNEHPGTNRRASIRPDKFAFLEDPKIIDRLISFRNEAETHIRLYLPAIHCSSCLYLLENLHRLQAGVLSSRVDFSAKQAFIIFDHRLLSLEDLAELLTAIGYEPSFHLHDLGREKPAARKNRIYPLGVAGFCFANIMLLSFPEYLGLSSGEVTLRPVFRILNFLLALPVLLYSARSFYISAWKGLRHCYLNIDAPIALAILVTFGRSAYEVLSGTGAGYFDSMTGIVFFMLVGRALQERTYRRLSFERDYTSYFPIAVPVVQDGKTVTKALPDVRCGDTLLIHYGELIPADGVLTRGEGLIDYSFVTGESLPVTKDMGEIVYAGGRQAGPAIEVRVTKEVAQSYLTQLWEREEFRKQDSTAKTASFVQVLSRYFTYIVLAIATLSAWYWWQHDPSRIGNAITAVLIVACPCALLLSSTFTEGNILKVMARNHFYLRHAQVIERIAATTHIIFDKTGTLTTGCQQDAIYNGHELEESDRRAIVSLAAQSSHPLSQSLARQYDTGHRIHVSEFREIPGKGIVGRVSRKLYALGSQQFVSGYGMKQDLAGGSRVYVSCEGKLLGYFHFINHYRDGIIPLVRQLPSGIGVSVLSGDNDHERERLQAMLGPSVRLYFNRQPHEKSEYIKELQRAGEKVMMIGDGLNDAAALRQSDTGIALSDDSNHFTPASDAILEAAQLPYLSSFMRLCRVSRRIIVVSFILSILYNIIGLYFAVLGQLSPMIAAILMPSSSLSILLVTFGSSSLAARRWLREKDQSAA